MKFKIFKVVIVSLSLISCGTNYTKIKAIEAFKQSVTYSCISEGMENKIYDSIVLEKDASFSYDGLMGANFYKIDSIGRSEGRKITRTPINDLGKKKMIHNRCLKYYKSGELNKLAKKWLRNEL
ncbi:hypothetical protein [Chryseobacterium echinoideorum]|uniref:hypothetical protein n=1 Tax=Chryseobacterium echinoideorum TaxID=1549648 RepID=UPI001184E4BD|nr:hypothetical protein [Chryseobacterium echinoideorum]